jgi:hypothetical protein
LQYLRFSSELPFTDCDLLCQVPNPVRLSASDSWYSNKVWRSVTPQLSRRFAAFFRDILQVLLDFLALVRFLILIASVHKLFDVCRDVFAKNNGFNAARLRSVIARHFRELMADLLWIITPLWTFDWSFTLVSQ